MINKNAFGIFCLVCLIAYLILLTRLIIFKFPDSMMEAILSNWSFDSFIRGIKSISLSPFQTISQALFNPQLRVELPTLIYNIVAFVPLGLLLPCIKPAFNRLFVVVLAGFLISAAFEVVQATTALGTGDIDDVILNVFGAVVGYLIFKLVVIAYQKLYQSSSEAYGFIK